MFKIDSLNHPKSVEALRGLRFEVSKASKQNWALTALKVARAAIVLAAFYIFEKVVPLAFRKIQPAESKPAAADKNEGASSNANDLAARVKLLTVVDDKRLDGKVDVDVLHDQIASDLKSFEKSDEIVREANAIVESEGLFANDENKELYLNAAAATYASTYNNYGPVVLEWMHATLERAVATNSQLVFMARDGLGPSKVAKLLKAKYPEKYGSVEISVLYFSRAVTIDWSSKGNNLEMAREYATQQGIKKDKNAIFVDVGYEGSMIEKVKEIMSPICTIEFSYLISFNEKQARGFMLQTPLNEMEKGAESGFKSIPHRCAGQNPSTYWLEDTHVGVLNTSDRLFRGIDGKIRPCAKMGIPAKKEQAPVMANGKYVKSTCKESNPKSYLYKRLGFKAIVDYARDHAAEKTPYLQGASPEVNRTMSEANKAAFDTFMQGYYVGNPYTGANKKAATRYSLAFHV